GLIDAGTYHSVWIREDGTVGTARNGQVPQHWKGITRIAASVGTVCLREDGTVVTAGSVQGKQSIATWRNIVDIDVSQSNTIGLTARGTVVVAGSNARKQCDVSAWTDVVDVALGNASAYGLTSRGTV